MRDILIRNYYLLWSFYIHIMNYFFKKEIANYKNIPIIINNRNRLTFLLDLIKALEIRGYKNIFIIDNDSTYEPLLNFYKNCPYHIFRLEKNVGHLALWDTKIYKKFERSFFVYTDSDVVPSQDCPLNFLEIFLDKMKEDKSIMKIGLSLKINDLPDHYSNKKDVIEWESQFNKTLTSDGGYFIANVDTTFALYRPFMSGGSSRMRMLRSKAPINAHHMPWYNDSNNLSDEELFYLNNSKTSTHWTSK